MNQVLAFGEILWDIIDGEAHLGGAPLNFAAHIKKCGGNSAIVSCLGNDKWGEKAITEVASLGVNTDLILRRNKKTGMVMVTLNQGQPDYEIIKPVAYDYIDSGRLDHDLIKQFSVFYFGTLAQRSDSSREALYDILERHDFGHVFYDVNLRKNSFNKDIVLKSLQYATIFKINDEEVPVVSEFICGKQLELESFCETLKSQFKQIKVVIITAGGDGCYVHHNKSLQKITAIPITVADTVGAGDSFSAAFLIRFLKDGDAKKAAEVANQVGGFVASQSGAIPNYSSELKRLFS